MVKRNSYDMHSTELGSVNKAFEAEGIDHELSLRRLSISLDGHKASITSDKAVLATEESDDDGEERQQWTNPLEFLMSCIAMSVGLGNIWRFPFTAYDNGGGAFLIPYIIVLFIIGKPMYFLEMALGQFTGYSAVRVWSVSPAMKGLGWGMMFATIAILTYYTSLMAITIFYFVASFNAVLPWSVCDPAWGDECYSSKPNASGDLGNTTGRKSSSELYFVKEVLKEYPNIDDGIGNPEWRLTLCLLFSWITIFLVILRGVKSSGKAAYFLALFPYVVLIVLLIRGCTLPGAVDGILYFVTPKWEELLNPTVWYAAVTQAFFSLSISFGSIIMYASYNGFSQNIHRDVLIVTTMDTLTSLLAGCTIFAIVGNLAFELGETDIGKVVKGDTGLAFITYPDAISKFDVVPQLFAVIFFLMLYTLGIGSSVALASAVIAIICDQFKTWKQWIVTAVICGAGFFIGLIYVTPGGQWMLTLVDYYCVTFVVFVLTVGEIATIAWIYGMERFTRDIQFMLNIRLSFYWRICWAIVTPIVLIVILVYSVSIMEPKQYDNKPFPPIAYTCAWIFAAFGIAQIPIWMCVEFFRRRHMALSDMFLGAFKPAAEWGPKSPKNRKLWIEYKERKKAEDKEQGWNAFMRIGRMLGGCWERK